MTNPETTAFAGKSENEYPVPSVEEIERAVMPYVIRRMPMESPEWREIMRRVERKELRSSVRRKLRAWLPWKKARRTQKVVSSHYETHWSGVPWPRTKDPDPDENPVVCTWRDEGMLFRRYGRKRAHHLVFASLLPGLEVKTALEVGAGNGLNLLVMSTLFPEIEWSGVELTKAGVDVARSVQGEPELPQVLRDFAIKPLADPAGHRRVKFEQGDAAKLPFPDKSFDLVFSFQAFEQMQAIRDQAMKELNRVARRWVIMTEPFTTFNKEPVQRSYRARLDYLDLAVEDLPRFGLTPEFQFADYPHKVTTASGVVLSKLC